MWTFEDTEQAKLQLLHFEALRERVAGILELKAAENLEEDVAQIMKHLSLVTDSYLVGEQTCYYILDEVGARLCPAELEDAGFRCAVFYDQSQEMAYSLLWPIRDIAEEEAATAVGLPLAVRKRYALPQAMEGLAEAEDAMEYMAALQSVRDSLSARQYDVGTVCRLLALSDCSCFGGQNLRGIAKAASTHMDQSMTADLVRLLLLNEPLQKHRVVELFGPTNFSTLCSLRVLFPLAIDVEADRGLWVSLVQFLPVEDVVVCTDFFQTAGTQRSFDPVLCIGMDSLGLVNATPRRTCARALDVCCGSGIQGIVACSTYAQHVVFVDPNPRAVRFTRFNLLLNGIGADRSEVHCDDLFGALSHAEPFDVILANPASFPNGQGQGCLDVFADGGASGEEILSNLIKAAPLHLSSTGRMHIASNFINVQQYSSKLQEDGTTLAMHFAPTYQQVDWEGKAKGQRAQNQGGASQARQTAVISHKPKFGNAMWGMLWSRHHPTVCGV
uniref:Methyltransferase small domain-containing protein n=1 Tax=Eutreptiella gymnastica TaxID=73025 RepID=A0A7S4FF26_9EUGL